MWRNITDLVFRGLGSERRYRMENPEDTAKMFRRRQAFWRGRNRKVLAQIAGLRAQKWEDRAKAKDGAANKC